MLKKVLVAVVAAGAMSVPLAGVAWADKPSDPGSNGNGIGAGGVPKKAATFANSFGPDANGNLPAPTGKASPGSAFSQAAKLPGNTPDAYGDFLNGFFGSRATPIATDFGRTVPGSATKLLTPGCGNGHGPVPTSGGTPAPCVANP